MQQIEINCSPNQRSCQVMGADMPHFSYPLAMAVKVLVVSQGQEHCQLALQLREQETSLLWQQLMVQVSQDRELIFSDSLQVLLKERVVLGDLLANSSKTYLFQFTINPELLVQQASAFTLYFDWRWFLRCQSAEDLGEGALLSDSDLREGRGDKVLSTTVAEHPSNQQQQVLVPIHSISLIHWLIGFSLLASLLFVIMKRIHVVYSKKKTKPTHSD